MEYKEYYLKFGRKEDGSLACLNTLLPYKTDSPFWYKENGVSKEVRDIKIVKLTLEGLEKLCKEQGI